MNGDLLKIAHNTAFSRRQRNLKSPKPSETQRIMIPTPFGMLGFATLISPKGSLKNPTLCITKRHLWLHRSTQPTSIFVFYSSTHVNYQTHVYKRCQLTKRTCFDKMVLFQQATKTSRRQTHEKRESLSLFHYETLQMPSANANLIAEWLS